MDLLVENLLESAKVRSMAPIGQTTFTDANLLYIGSEEMLLEIVAEMMSVREDFFLTRKTVAIEANVAHYAIPKRAIGTALKFVYYIDAQGRELPLQRADASNSYQYAAAGSRPSAISIEGDEIVLMPAPSTAVGSIEFGYYAKPSRLVATTSCAKITAISSSLGTTTFTVDTDLTASLVTGNSIDLVSAQSPFLMWADEIAITGISTTTIQVATANVSNAAGTVEPQVNDYICPTGFSNIPMLPTEFHPALAQKLANRLMFSLGHLDKLQVGEQLAERMMKRALKLIKNRVETAPERAVNRRGLTAAFG